MKKVIAELIEICDSKIPPHKNHHLLDAVSGRLWNIRLELGELLAELDGAGLSRSFMVKLEVGKLRDEIYELIFHNGQTE